MKRSNKQGNHASKEGGSVKDVNDGDVEMNGDEADPASNDAQAEAFSSFLRGFTYLRMLEKGETYLSSLKNQQEKQRYTRGTMALDCLQYKRAQKRFNQHRLNQSAMSIDMQAKDAAGIDEEEKAGGQDGFAASSKRSQIRITSTANAQARMPKRGKPSVNGSEQVVPADAAKIPVPPAVALLSSAQTVTEQELIEYQKIEDEQKKLFGERRLQNKQVDVNNVQQMGQVNLQSAYREMILLGKETTIIQEQAINIIDQISRMVSENPTVLIQTLQQASIGLDELDLVKKQLIQQYQEQSEQINVFTTFLTQSEAGQALFPQETTQQMAQIDMVRVERIQNYDALLAMTKQFQDLFQRLNQTNQSHQGIAAQLQQHQQALQAYELQQQQQQQPAQAREPTAEEMQLQGLLAQAMAAADEINQNNTQMQAQAIEGNPEAAANMAQINQLKQAGLDVDMAAVTAQNAAVDQLNKQQYNTYQAQQEMQYQYLLEQQLQELMTNPAFSISSDIQDQETLQKVQDLRNVLHQLVQQQSTGPTSTDGKEQQKPASSVPDVAQVQAAVELKSVLETKQEQEKQPEQQELAKQLSQAEKTQLAIQSCLKAAQEEDFKTSKSNFNKAANMMHQRDEIEMIYQLQQQLNTCLNPGQSQSAENPAQPASETKEGNAAQTKEEEAQMAQNLAQILSMELQKQQSDSDAGQAAQSTQEMLAQIQQLIQHAQIPAPASQEKDEGSPDKLNPEKQSKEIPSEVVAKDVKAESGEAKDDAADADNNGKAVAGADGDVAEDQLMINDEEQDRKLQFILEMLQPYAQVPAILERLVQIKSLQEILHCGTTQEKKLAQEKIVEIVEGLQNLDLNSLQLQAMAFAHQQQQQQQLQLQSQQSAGGELTAEQQQLLFQYQQQQVLQQQLAEQQQQQQQQQLESDHQQQQIQQFLQLQQQIQQLAGSDSTDTHGVLQMGQQAQSQYLLQLHLQQQMQQLMMEQEQQEQQKDQNAQAELQKAVTQEALAQAEVGDKADKNAADQPEQAVTSAVKESKNGGGAGVSEQDLAKLAESYQLSIQELEQQLALAQMAKQQQQQQQQEDQQQDQPAPTEEQPNKAASGTDAAPQESAKKDEEVKEDESPEPVESKKEKQEENNAAAENENGALPTPSDNTNIANLLQQASMDQFQQQLKEQLQQSESDQQHQFLLQSLNMNFAEQTKIKALLQDQEAVQNLFKLNPQQLIGMFEHLQKLEALADQMQKMILPFEAAGATGGNRSITDQQLAQVQAMAAAQIKSATNPADAALFNNNDGAEDPQQLMAQQQHQAQQQQMQLQQQLQQHQLQQSQADLVQQLTGGDGGAAGGASSLNQDQLSLMQLHNQLNNQFEAHQQQQQQQQQMLQQTQNMEQHQYQQQIAQQMQLSHQLSQQVKSQVGDTSKAPIVQLQQGRRCLNHLFIAHMIVQRSGNGAPESAEPHPQQLQPDYQQQQELQQQQLHHQHMIQQLQQQAAQMQAAQIHQAQVQQTPSVSPEKQPINTAAVANSPSPPQSQIQQQQATQQTTTTAAANNDPPNKTNTEMEVEAENAANAADGGKEGGDVAVAPEEKPSASEPPIASPSSPDAQKNVI